MSQSRGHPIHHSTGPPIPFLAPCYANEIPSAGGETAGKVLLWGMPDPRGTDGRRWMEWGLIRAGLRWWRSQMGEGDQQRYGRKVTDGEGVVVDELWARAVLLEVVAGPDAHGLRRVMVNSLGKRRQAKKRSGQRR
jgi:hypothetical protein